MENKSSGYVDLRSPPPVQASKNISCSGTGPYVGPAGLSATERSAPGSTGPGMGNVKKLNSDDAPIGPTYP